jgi:hypothetical protein
VYERRELAPAGNNLKPRVVETVRLDVDGWYPQMMASGSFSRTLLLHGGVVGWAAHLSKQSPGVWYGPIFTRWQDTHLLPHSHVRIEVTGAAMSAYYSLAELTITFGGWGVPNETRTLTFASPWFRSVDIEWDTVEGATRVTYIDTGAHSNRPATLLKETLSIIDVYDRAGVELRRGPREKESVVPAGFAGEDARWSKSELNDVMKQYWDHSNSGAHWAMWLLFAGLYEDSDTRGIMFDDSGIYKRQGAAVFNDQWLEDTDTTGFSQPDAHIRRRRFTTTCHELGHCFNLIHSDQHAKPDWWPWPLGHAPGALSFMSHPESAGTHNFFSEFDYRFDNQELQFIRHAPDWLVQMGGPRYEDKWKHSLPAGVGGWTLEATVRRRDGVFDFLEPLVVDLALTNRSKQPQVIDAGVFRDGRNLTVSVMGPHKTWATLRPFVIECLAQRHQVLRPGESIRHSAFVSVGLGGWLISEPGPYQIQVELSAGAVAAVSEPMRLRVAHPCGRGEEVIAQDYFTADVGRVLAFGGSSVLDGVNTLLQRITDEYRERPFARHALLSLGLPKMKARKVLHLPEGTAPLACVAADGGSFIMARANPDEAKNLLSAALRSGNGDDTFPSGFFESTVARVSDWLEREGEPDAAERLRLPVRASSASN